MFISCLQNTWPASDNINQMFYLTLQFFTGRCYSKYYKILVSCNFFVIVILNWFFSFFFLTFIYLFCCVLLFGYFIKLVKNIKEPMHSWVKPISPLKLQMKFLYLALQYWDVEEEILKKIRKHYKIYKNLIFISINM